MELSEYEFVLAVSDFTSIAVLVVVVVLMAVGMLVVTHLINPRRVGPVKHGTYESGMDPIGDTRRRFNVRFYLIAVLFLIFGVEVVFLYPWAIMLPRMSKPADAAQAASVEALAGYSPMYMLGAVAVFFALLIVGFIYEWRRGVFKWN